MKRSISILITLTIFSLFLTREALCCSVPYSLLPSRYALLAAAGILFLAAFAIFNKRMVILISLILLPLLLFIVFAIDFDRILTFRFYTLALPVIAAVIVIILGLHSLLTKNLILLGAVILIPLAAYLYLSINNIPLMINVGHGLCEYNLKSLGEAIENYSSKHDGKYPETMEQLCPEYIKEIPECLPPTDRSRNLKIYNLIYGLGNAPYRYEINADASLYTIICQSKNHTAFGISAGYPQYNSVEGLIKP